MYLKRSDIQGSYKCSMSSSHSAVLQTFMGRSSSSRFNIYKSCTNIVVNDLSKNSTTAFKIKPLNSLKQPHTTSNWIELTRITTITQRLSPPLAENAIKLINDVKHSPWLCVCICNQHLFVIDIHPTERMSISNLRYNYPIFFTEPDSFLRSRLASAFSFFAAALPGLAFACSEIENGKKESVNTIRDCQFH